MSIGQVARRTGISARMLRHYDHLGLYHPSRVSENGYRWYDTTTLPRLYRIIALRRAGMSLTDIGQILDERSGEADALRQHLRELRAEQLRLADLIASIEEQIEQLDSARIEDPDSLRTTYRSELSALTERLREKHPAPLVDSYAAYAQAVESMSVAEVEHMVAASATLMTRLAALVEADVPPDAPQARRGIAEHYAMLTQTVPLSLDAYRSLSRSYVDDPLQNSIARSFHPDLPVWLSHAIESFTAGSGDSQQWHAHAPQTTVLVGGRHSRGVHRDVTSG